MHCSSNVTTLAVLQCGPNQCHSGQAACARPRLLLQRVLWRVNVTPLQSTAPDIQCPLTISVFNDIAKDPLGSNFSTMIEGIPLYSDKVDLNATLCAIADEIEASKLNGTVSFGSVLFPINNLFIRLR